VTMAERPGRALREPGQTSDRGVGLTRITCITPGARQLRTVAYRHLRGMIHLGGVTIELALGPRPFTYPLMTEASRVLMYSSISLASGSRTCRLREKALSASYSTGISEESRVRRVRRSSSGDLPTLNAT